MSGESYEKEAQEDLLAAEQAAAQAAEDAALAAEEAAREAAELAAEAEQEVEDFLWGRGSSKKKKEKEKKPKETPAAASTHVVKGASAGNGVTGTYGAKAPAAKGSTAVAAVNSSAPAPVAKGGAAVAATNGGTLAPAAKGGAPEPAAKGGAQVASATGSATVAAASGSTPAFAPQGGASTPAAKDGTLAPTAKGIAAVAATAAAAGAGASGAAAASDGGASPKSNGATAVSDSSATPTANGATRPPIATPVEVMLEADGAPKKNCGDGADTSTETARAGLGSRRKSYAFGGKVGSHTHVFSGNVWRMKKGEWVERFMEVRDGSLLTYKSKEEGKLLTAVPLLNIEECKLVSSDEPTKWSIKVDGTEWQIDCREADANDQPTAKQWVWYVARACALHTGASAGEVYEHPDHNDADAWWDKHHSKRHRETHGLLSHILGCLGNKNHQPSSSSKNPLK